MVLLQLAGSKRRKHQPQGASKKAREPAGRKLRFESLEDRALLSVAPGLQNPIARPPGRGKGDRRAYKQL